MELHLHVGKGCSHLTAPLGWMSKMAHMADSWRWLSAGYLLGYGQEHLSIAAPAWRSQGKTWQNLHGLF